MAQITADRVRDTSTTTGTGAISVSGTAPTGYRTFSAVCTTNDTFYYAVQHQTAAEWEVGLGTYSSANTITRTTIYASSASGSAVNFSAGTKDIFITLAATRTVQLNSDGAIEGITDAGNLTFTGTGRRITGDFSNATDANRVAFQTSTTNSGTRVNILSNGTGTASSLDVFGLSDPTNAAVMRIRQSGSESQVQATITGTGTYLPMTFYTGGSERMRIVGGTGSDVGFIGIGTTAPDTNLSVFGSTAVAADVGGEISIGGFYNGSSKNSFASVSGVNQYGTGNTAGQLVLKTRTNFGSLTERMRIDSSGNVGIGSTSPNLSSSSTALTINTGTAANYSAMELASGGTLNFYINANNAASYIASAGTRPMVFYTNSSERMRIDSSGNVGIGTSSPSYRLTSVGGAIQLSGGTTSQEGIRIQRASGYASISGINNDNNAYNALAFFTSATEAMRIDTSGNVGVGTSSPASKLDVVGANNIVRSTASSGYASFYANGATGSAAYYFFAVNGTETARLTSDSANYLAFSTGSSATERMRIDSSGNVLVGTTVANGLLSIDRKTSASAIVHFENNATNGAWTAYSYNGTVYGYIGSGSNLVTGAATSDFVLRSTANMIFGVGTAEKMRISSSGEVIVGTTDQGAYNLQCNGTGVWGAGAYVNGSDARIKEDVSPITSGLDVVEKLNPVQFRYKEDWSKDRSLQPGFMAQELQEALAGKDYLDGVVQQGPEYLSVSYQTLIPVLVKAIQELKAELDALKGAK